MPTTAPVFVRAAALTRMSTPPNAAATSAAMCRTAWSSPVSQTAVITCPAFSPPASRTAAAAAASAPESRATSATCAPSADSAFATASPTPRLPPVTIARLPTSSRSTPPILSPARPGRQVRGGGEHLEGGGLPARVGLVEGSGPAQPELAAGVPRVAPYGVGVGEDERPVGRLAAQSLELMQVADEDALELRLVAVAAGRLARLGEDARRPGQAAQRRVRDELSRAQVALVAGELAQRGEPAEDHALVVGPGRAAVVRAPRGEPVVDQAVRPDHAAVAQPFPGAQRPVQVFRVLRHPLGQPRGERQEQIAGDRVLVTPVGVPPQPAAAGL